MEDIKGLPDSVVMNCYLRKFKTKYRFYHVINIKRSSQLLELNKIYNASWQDGFKDIPDKYIDLIITSPPYNLGGKFHTGNTRYNQAYNTYDDNVPEDEYQKQQNLLVS